MTADKLSRLVAESVQKQAAPIPADMQHVSAVRLDGTVLYGYLVNGGMYFVEDSDPLASRGRPLYVRAA